MFGSVTGLLWALPQYERASLAAAELYKLETKLEHAVKQPAGGERDPWAGRFSTLRAVDLQFRYDAVNKERSFRIGPLSLTVVAGEIVFVVGANGSGKSTLMKVLTWIYAPSDGELYIDDVKVQPDNVQAYREMIAAVYSDFHLFKKLYGIPDAKEEEVNRLLRQFQLADKLSFSNRSLSTLDLSTGQRKRLAMVVALLEDRPIYVFDEWAADQDPSFRRFFYEELLQDLKRRGKTIIAISHDDRYFHCADRVITMEEGQIRSASEHVAPSPSGA